QKKIFEPFYTTKEEGKGTGLGLATVFGILKQNKGHIRVYSEPGIGTTFNIYWPVFENPNEFVSNTEEPETSIAGEEFIVLVEDDKDIIFMVESGLKKLGYSILAYSDPMIALEEIPKIETPIDLLITDVIMPHMDGKTFTDKLSKVKPGLNILFSSGYTDEHIVNAGILKKEVNFISKPYNLVLLTQKIKEITENSTPDKNTK
ncbi:MAG: response regulator, partial [Candidatus Marinimicrobia bacterium]|nr:response regulator [Candidatus Neomarinimicrobiota bacterium]